MIIYESVRGVSPIMMDPSALLAKKMLSGFPQVAGNLDRVEAERDLWQAVKADPTGGAAVGVLWLGRGMLFLAKCLPILHSTGVVFFR